MPSNSVRNRLSLAPSAARSSSRSAFWCRRFAIVSPRVAAQNAIELVQRHRHGQCRPLEKPYFKTAVAAQLHFVGQSGDEKQAATAFAERVGHSRGVEGGGVEAPTPVSDQDLQVVTPKAESDLDLLTRTAVADGVRDGLPNAHHHLVDDPSVAAVQREVVAHTTAGAGQPRSLRPQREPLARGRRATAISTPG